MNFASVVEKATHFCSFNCQNTVPLKNVIKDP
jgi:hypothetical protein